MPQAFKVIVERYKQELLKQIKPGTGTVNLYVSKIYREEEEMAVGEAAVAIAEMLHRPVTLFFTDAEHKR